MTNQLICHTLYSEKKTLVITALFIQLTRQTSDLNVVRIRHQLITDEKKKQRRLLDDKTDKSIQISHICSSDA